MSSETKTCQSCKKDFVIEPEDFSFYEKIKVPPPTWCPRCRLERRLSFANVWNLYWRTCDKCGVKMLSNIPLEQHRTVYCQPCWWADDWDGTEYGREYDPSQPFLAQFHDLLQKIPHPCLDSEYLTLKNSEYVNGVAWSKDCYLTFWADFCENVYYSSILNGLKHSLDCVRGFDSELCYESVGLKKNYRTFFSDECDNCVDVWFSRNCYGCTDCIGCVNLRGATHCIWNKKYSKEEYETKVKEIRLDSRENLDKLAGKASKFWLEKPYREHNGHSLNVNVEGEHVYTSKNCKDMYLVNGTEDSRYTQFITVPPVRDCYDYTGWGNNATRIYETFGAGENADSVFFSFQCWPDCLDVQYCYWTIQGKHDFGCAGLKRKQYCILNKEYPKEEYEKLKKKIIEGMEKNPYIDPSGKKYTYGEFFPLEFSPFPYNISKASRFLPKNKEEALQEGYTWKEEIPLEHVTTFESKDLPDTIRETGEEILKEIIKCDKCQKGYKITKGEFDLMRKLDLPLPHRCPKCRENDRFDRMTKPGLYERSCDKCGLRIKTPYPPDDPRIVYCVKDYQAEFL